ncbi:MAG: hypothetical protein LBJ57_05375 [Prevotellaceae bacterium]|jgi:hypothetical protein|nr:hypothetical protein [Prevotellaceae bacterium]
MRRKTVILATFLCLASHAARAQYTYNPFRIDVGAGLSFPVNNFGIGILGSIEPKYAIGQFSVGAHVELHVLGSSTEEYTSISKYNNALLLTGDYHFTSDVYRPFVGLGVGSYLLAATVHSGSDYDYSEQYPSNSYSERYILFGQNVGIMLRAGCDLPHVRGVVQYNFVRSGKKDNVSVNFDYLSVGIAVSIGGGRVD